MKKTLALFLLYASFLGGCQSKGRLDDAHYQQLMNDEAVFEETRKAANPLSDEALFKSQVVYEDGDTDTRYTLEIKESRQTLSHVRVIMIEKGYTEKTSQYFYFGYEHDYTLLTSDQESDKANYRIKAIYIGFSQKTRKATFDVMVLSDEASLTYTLESKPAETKTA